MVLAPERELSTGSVLLDFLVKVNDVDILKLTLSRLAEPDR